MKFVLEIAAVSQRPLAAAEKRSVWAPGDGQLTGAGYGEKNWQLKQDVQKISKISKLLQLRKAGAGAGCTSKHSISKGESNESNESNSHVCVVQGLERPARSRRRLDEKPVDVV